MAEHNRGYSSSPVSQPNYQPMNLPGETQPVQQNMYGQQPGSTMMYGQPQGAPPGYTHQQGPPQMYDQGKGNMMSTQPQGQQMMYGNNQRNGNQPPEYWMERPLVMGCPPGLEYLTQIDQLLVKQKIEMLEVLTGFETNNRYDVKNILGQTVYKAKEDTHCCSRYWCGPNRPFVIHIKDNLDNEVIQIRRFYKCHFMGHCFSCAKCCQDEIEVEAPPGVVVGYVKQCYEGCNIRYSIMNEDREVVLRIHGPNYFYCYCPGEDYPLSLMSAKDDVTVGRISRQWSNIVQELFTDADNFGIQFPMDLDVKIKAVVLGAVFLIDFMFFEKDQRNQNNY